MHLHITRESLTISIPLIYLLSEFNLFTCQIIMEFHLHGNVWTLFSLQCSVSPLPFNLSNRKKNYVIWLTALLTILLDVLRKYGFKCQVQLLLYFMLKYVMEILLAESSVVTTHYFIWSTNSVAIFLVCLGLTVLLVNIVVGNYISNIFEER